MNPEPNFDPHPHPNPDVESLTAFRTVVESRRSVRAYTTERVPEPVMRACFDLAHLSPSASNLQPWEFHWVRSESTQTELRRLCLGQPASESAAELVVCVARTAWRAKCEWLNDFYARKGVKLPKPFDIYYAKIVPFTYALGFLNVGGLLKRLLLASVRLFRPMSKPPTSHAELKLSMAKSTALAAQTFMLSLRAHGYDSCALDGHDPFRVARLLKLPRDAFIVMVIAVGRRAPEDEKFGPRVRFPREDHVKIW